MYHSHIHPFITFPSNFLHRVIRDFTFRLSPLPLFFTLVCFEPLATKPYSVSAAFYCINFFPKKASEEKGESLRSICQSLQQNITRPEKIHLKNRQRKSIVCNTISTASFFLLFSFICYHDNAVPPVYLYFYNAISVSR